jgi:hypothetical protein
MMTNVPASSHPDDAEAIRRARLEKLLELAAMYKGWSKRRLGEELARDDSKLVPASGNPKLDLVVTLSELLDWPVGDLIETMWDEPIKAADLHAGKSFDELDQECVRLHDEGKYRQRIGVAQAMHAMAKTGRERAIAKFREYGAWEGLGRYSKCVDVLREALAERGVAATTRLLLRSNLAWSLFAQGHLYDAMGMAQLVCGESREIRTGVTETLAGAISQAHETIGFCRRSLVSEDEVSARDHAANAVKSFAEGLASLDLQMSLRTRPQSYFEAKKAFGSFVCLEMKAFLGEIEPSAGVQTIMQAVCESPRSGSLAESAEWADAECWGCISGCAIALRHLPDREKSRTVAVFCEKGYELADRRDNWMMRQRIFEIDHSIRSFEQSSFGIERDWVLDRDDIKVLVGTMGRFSGFRARGWSILNSARIVREAKP